MCKIISSPDAATGTTTATVKDFSADVKKFGMWVKHRTLEKFFDYIEYVSKMTHRFSKDHNFAFELKEDYIEEWTDFINETYGESVVDEAIDFYNEELSCYWLSIKNICVEYAVKHDFIVKVDYTDIYVVGELYANNIVHCAAKYIKGYAYAYEAAVNFGIAKSKFRHAIKIPFSKFYKKDVEILKKYQDKIFELVYMLDVESMIERVSVYDEENCVIVCYK